MNIVLRRDLSKKNIFNLESETFFTLIQTEFVKKM